MEFVEDVAANTSGKMVMFSTPTGESNVYKLFKNLYTNEYNYTPKITYEQKEIYNNDGYIDAKMVTYNKKIDTDFTFRHKLAKQLKVNDIQLTPCEVNKLTQEAKRDGYIII